MRSVIAGVIFLSGATFVGACSTDPVYTSESESKADSGDTRSPVDADRADISRVDDIRSDLDIGPDPDTIKDADIRPESDGVGENDGHTESDILADATGESDADEPADAGEQSPPDPGKCRGGDDCQSGAQTCVAPDEFLGCGACRDDFTVCVEDSDCDSMRADPSDAERRAYICSPVEARDCACDASIKICKPACTESSDCDAGQHCNTQGRCAPTPCQRGNEATARACPRHFSCTGPSLQQVSDASRGTCERVSCQSDSDCTSIGGTCVKGQCYGEFGTCELPRP